MTTSSADWQARQYTLFEAERTRPVRDLLNATQAKAARTAVDLGCGPGNSTETLVDYAPHARVVGVDNSSDMIESAKKRLPDVEFELADISAWQGEGPFDLILANASLQWVPDHETVFPSLVGKLSKGGFCIIDDYALPTCAAAVNDFRSKHGIDAAIIEIDWTGRYWRKA